MEEQDAAHLSGRKDTPHGIDNLGIIGRPALPVLAVHRPENHRNPQTAGYIDHVLVIGTIGRPHIDRICSQIPEQLVGNLDFLLFAVAGYAPQIRMRKGMIADLVPLGHNALHMLGIELDVLAEHEEGGRNAVFAQDIKNMRRIAGRAVIEGQGAQILAHRLAHDGIAVVDLRIGRSRAQGQTDSTGQKTCPETPGTAWKKSCYRHEYSVPAESRTKNVSGGQDRHGWKQFLRLQSATSNHF